MKAKMPRLGHLNLRAGNAPKVTERPRSGQNFLAARNEVMVNACGL
jgi:hypothetical protein